jgi:hypothetical protein
MLGLFYFLFIFSILVMISVVTKIVLFIVAQPVADNIKHPITSIDKISFAIAFSYFMTYIKFF